MGHRHGTRCVDVTDLGDLIEKGALPKACRLTTIILGLAVDQMVNCNFHAMKTSR